MSQSCEGLPEPAFAGEVMTASVTATRLGQNTLLRILHTAGVSDVRYDLRSKPFLGVAVGSGRPTDQPPFTGNLGTEIA